MDSNPDSLPWDQEFDACMLVNSSNYHITNTITNKVQAFVHEVHSSPTGAAWCIWGPKAKIDYLVLDVKLLLINMNYVEFFSFFRNFINRKSLTKFFILVDVANW